MEVLEARSLIILNYVLRFCDIKIANYLLLIYFDIFHSSIKNRLSLENNTLNVVTHKFI